MGVVVDLDLGEFGLGWVFFSSGLCLAVLETWKFPVKRVLVFKGTLKMFLAKRRCQWWCSGAWRG